MWTETTGDRGSSKPIRREKNPIDKYRCVRRSNGRPLDKYRCFEQAGVGRNDARSINSDVCEGRTGARSINTDVCEGRTSARSINTDVSSEPEQPSRGFTLRAPVGLLRKFRYRYTYMYIWCRPLQVRWCLVTHQISVRKSIGNALGGFRLILLSFPIDSI